MELIAGIVVVLALYPLYCLFAESRKVYIVLACIWTGILVLGAVSSGLCWMGYQRGLAGRIQPVDVATPGTFTVRFPSLPGARGMSVSFNDVSKPALERARSLSWKAANSRGKVDVFPYPNEPYYIVDIFHVDGGYEPWVDLTYSIVEGRTQPLELRIDLPKREFKTWVVNRDIAQLSTWILSGAALFAFAGLSSQVIRYRRNRAGPGRHAPPETP